MGQTRERPAGRWIGTTLLAATLMALLPKPGAAAPVCTNASPNARKRALQYAALPGIQFLPPGSAYRPNLPSAVLAPTAEAFLDRARPATILDLPFGTEREVVLGQGWVYDSGKSHRGLDYHREDVDSGEDPTFPVLSMGDGTVLAVIHLGPESPNGGNTVIIEHHRRGQPSSFSIYMHLRNGRSHDVGQALTSLTPSSVRCKGKRRYRRWADRHPDAIAWGRESDTIRVVPGQKVVRGEQIGWAGNTGCGAAPKGLDSDGSEQDWKVNTHLHMNYAVEDPALATPTMRTAVIIDPYGVFAQEDTGCYESPAQRARYRRHLMPFPSDFVRVEGASLLNHRSYYPDLDMEPRTLSLARDGFAEVLAAGSFQGGAAPAAESAIAMSAAQFGAAVSLHEANGFRVHRPSVHVPAGGEPLYTATFERLADGETYMFFPELSPFTFAAAQTSLAADGLRVDDYYEFEHDGAARIVAGFTSLPGQFYDNLTAEAVAPIVATERAGNRPAAAIHRSEASGAYSLVVAPSPHCAEVRVGLDAVQLHLFHAEFVLGQHYSLQHLQAYDNASRYNVIARRARTLSTCP